MDWLKHGGVFLFRIQVGRRCDTDRAGTGGAEVRQNIAEQIRPDHDIEPLRIHDELGREDTQGSRINTVM